jgi:hypothetical protein
VTLDPGALAVLVGVVALGPWGLVLVVALWRGYNLTIRLRRRHRREREPDRDTPLDDGPDRDR